MPRSAESTRRGCRNSASTGGSSPATSPPRKCSAFFMYRERAGTGAVVHLHSTHSVAVHSGRGQPRRRVAAAHRLFRHAGRPVTARPLFSAWRPVLPRPSGLAGEHHAVLLANHGPVVAGSNLADASICDRRIGGDGQTLSAVARRQDALPDASASQGTCLIQPSSSSSAFASLRSGVSKPSVNQS